jgi:hypothetical protein
MSCRHSFDGDATGRVCAVSRCVTIQVSAAFSARVWPSFQYLAFMIPTKGTANPQCKLVLVVSKHLGGVMRRDRSIVALLAGSLSLAAVVVTAQFLDAADLPTAPQQQLTQQVQPQGPAQPEPTSSAPAELRSPPAENPVPGQPAGNTANPPEAVPLDRQEAQGVLGREVRSAADENMGRIIDVIVDRVGNVRAAVIDFGGFLGVGSRKIAVDWNALHFGAVDGKDRITVGFTRDQVKAAPEYQDGKSIVVLSAIGGSDRFRVTTSVNSEK